MPYTLDINLEDTRWQHAVPSLIDWCNKVTTATLDACHLAPIAHNICLALLLTNDITIQQLNAQFRHKNTPTNVLSFPQYTLYPNDLSLISNQEDEVMLGDIAIAFETMQKESIEHGIPLQHHLAHLLTHGILHLLGYDHLEDDDAEKMEQQEINILATLGITSPYTDNETPSPPK